MGGASVAVPLDSATTITNPAGMKDAGRRFDLGLTIAHAESKYDATSNLFAGIPLVLQSGATMESDARPFLVPAIGVIFPLDNQFTAGVGCYGVSGVCTDYPRNLYNNITYVKYQALKIAPALSFSYEDIFSVGVAANIDYATMDYEAATPGNIRHANGKSAGGGYTIGVLVKPMNGLDIDLPKDVFTVGFAFESEQWFADFVYDTIKGVDKLSFNLPPTVTLGFGLRPIDSLRLALDIQWIHWSDVLGHNKPRYNVNHSGAAAWDANWRDQTVYKLGLQYNLLKNVAVRAGYNYGKHPLRVERPFENIAIPAITQHHITAGVGVDDIIVKGLGLNVGFVISPDTVMSTQNAGTFINNAHITTMSYSIDAGITYKF
ncbi:MAG: outer membrane protein transport protein [Candidatus Omnitrophota bacterium]